MACHLFPALTNGFSGLPPPATVPIEAMQFPSKAFSFFEGISNMTLSFVLDNILANVPEALTNFPPSPFVFSTLYTSVPIGISDNNIVFPFLISVLFPIEMLSPTAMPSGAIIYPSSPSSYLINAKGALCAGLCSSLVTVPNAASIFGMLILCLASPLYLCLRLTYLLVPLPLFWLVILFPILHYPQPCHYIYCRALLA